VIPRSSLQAPVGIIFWQVSKADRKVTIFISFFCSFEQCYPCWPNCFGCKVMTTSWLYWAHIEDTVSCKCILCASYLEAKIQYWRIMVRCVHVMRMYLYRIKEKIPWGAPRMPGRSERQTDAYVRAQPTASPHFTCCCNEEQERSEERKC
jgi:hypothetical protein